MDEQDFAKSLIIYELSQVITWSVLLKYRINK